jgi:hypothetical protein
MTRWLFVFALSLAAAGQADELREQQLEQQLRELRQRVEAQSRRIDQLENSLRLSGLARVVQSPTPPPATPSSPWLVASNWERVRPGMRADEATAILGEPTSERPGDGGTTMLLYALEIQEGVFLAGRVEVRDDQVIAVQKPELR